LVDCGGRTIKRESSSIGGINLWGITEKHIDSYDLGIIEGRYFSNREFNYSTNVAIIGHNLTKKRFSLIHQLENKSNTRFKYIVIGLMDLER
jgi:putative ABC transport system permease protein